MNNNFTNEKKQYKCFCGNCGEKGHINKCCNMPITSIGIIAYYFDSFEKKYKYLIIRRRDTLGYVDFLRGKYNTKNATHIQNLINEMTNDEKERIVKYDFQKLWGELWKNYNEKIDINSKHKFMILKQNLNSKFNLIDFISKSNTSWEEPEWGFPKGRRNQNEKDYIAALREFNEETGVPTERIKIIQNIKPFEECFIGSNFKAYKHKYYLAKLQLNDKENIDEVINLDNFQESEVSKIGFYSCEEAVNKFRSYNRERCILLQTVEKILQTYKIE